MIRVGNFYELKVAKLVDFGVYLSDEDDVLVLLPRKEVPEGTKEGNKIRVFIYRDSDDRLIATIKKPKITFDEMEVLEVKEVTKVGAFLDWGLDKDLLLPYKEMIDKVKRGDKFLAALYVDKSDRLCGTMKVSKFMQEQSPYNKNDKVSGVVLNINPDMGAFIAVDKKYFGMIPKNEIHEKLTSGQWIDARVTSVRPDGKLNLSLKEKAYLQMDEDVVIIENVIKEYAGILPYDDKAAPMIIEKDFKMSKNAFKRGVGHLMKSGKVTKKDGKLYLNNK